MRWASKHSSVIIIIIIITDRPDVGDKLSQSPSFTRDWNELPCHVTSAPSFRFVFLQPSEDS